MTSLFYFVPYLDFGTYNVYKLLVYAYKHIKAFECTITDTKV